MTSQILFRMPNKMEVFLTGVCRNVGKYAGAKIDTLSEVFLTGVCRNIERYAGAKIDTLSVDIWHKNWKESDVGYLDLMCRKYGVKRLLFVPNRGRVQWSQMDLLGYSGRPFLVKEIVIHHDGENLPFHMNRLFGAATIIKIGCYILSDDEYAIRSRVRSFFDFMWEEKWLKAESIRCFNMSERSVLQLDLTIREIKFDTPGHNFRPDMLPPDDFIAGRQAMTIVKNNWISWRNCESVTMILLTRRIIKTQQLDINVAKLIARLIWATRKSSAWTPKTQLVQAILDKFRK